MIRTRPSVEPIAPAPLEELLLQVVHAAPIGFHFYRLDGDQLIFEGASSGADRLLGLDNSQFIGMTIEQAFPPLVATEVPERYRRSARYGEVWSAERVEYEDDQIRGAFQLLAFRTRPGHMAVMFLDITERKRDEAERERIEAQIAEARKMEAIGRLAGGIAHDFNNLLMAIRGNAELAQRALADGEPLLDELEEITRATDRAAHLTRQLLAFSRGQPLQRRLVDLNEVVRRAERMLERLIGEDVQLIIQAADGLEPVLVDPHQVDQILLNLAVNARDAMPRGGRFVIRTANAALSEGDCKDLPGLLPGRYAMLAISDTGVGMDDRTKERIFEPFFSTKERASRTGLGLSTVYGIVQQNKGGIAVYSAVGRGTTFCIYFRSATGLPEPLGTPEAGPAVKSGSETILLVEDDSAVRELARRGLVRLGYHVIEAQHGPAALAAAEQHGGPIALLLTDVVLPGMNGQELYETLRARHPTLKVLYMSGYSEDAIANRGIGQNDAPLVRKPASANALAARLREILDQA